VPMAVLRGGRWFALSMLLSAVSGASDPIRLGNGLTILSIHPGTKEQPTTAGAVYYPHPKPRLAGFSPLVAITTSSKHSVTDIEYEHVLTTFYDCNAGPPGGGTCGSLHPPSDENYVIGVLDSGSVVDLAAGTGADMLGLSGVYLTPNVIPIGGVGGEVNAAVSQPLGIYAQGLSAVGSDGRLVLSQLYGHSNVSAVVAPPIVCAGQELVTAFVGTPLIAFFTTIIRIDTPRTVFWNGRTLSAPDVHIQGQSSAIPDFPRAFAMELGGISPVTTSSYFPDFEDLVTPLVPTQLSFTPLSFPTGGVFFSNVLARMGDPGPSNFPTTMRLMVDTGAQSSILSPAMAAELNLPIDPDFTVDACGVGGLIEGIPGYYIDYVKINAFGGALEFSRVPFVMLDLISPEGGSLDGVLGMNFFWDRNVIFEPSVTTSSFFHVSDPIPVPFGDFDVNLRVDLQDWAIFAICRNGPSGSVMTAECEPFDGDENGRIDLREIARFQNCASGDAVADPHCGL